MFGFMFQQCVVKCGVAGELCVRLGLGEGENDLGKMRFNPLLMLI